MWPFRLISQQQRYRSWRSLGGLFAVALSLALMFQACGSPVNETASNNGQNNGQSIDQTADTPAQTTDTKTNGTLNALDKEHKGDEPIATPAAMAEPTVPVVGEMVEYATIDGQAVMGYLARPETPKSDALPAIMAIHEWWGLNDNIKAIARRLAVEGYTVLAIDLYGGQVASDPEQAKELMRTVMDNPGPAQDNLTLADEFLTEDYSAPKLGVIGWCFGGNWALRSGLLLENLDAIAIYYGQLILQPEALDGLQAPVIGFFGEDDSSIPVEDVENFESALNRLNKPVEIHLYAGAGHAFANPSGNNYEAEAAEDAWKKTTAFFAEQLKG